MYKVSYTCELCVWKKFAAVHTPSGQKWAPEAMVLIQGCRARLLVHRLPPVGPVHGGIMRRNAGPQVRDNVRVIRRNVIVL